MREKEWPTDETELAEFLEARRGDMTLWSEKPSKANVRRGASVVFSVRFNRRELELLRDRAKAEGITISELIRRSALGPIDTFWDSPSQAPEFVTAVLQREPGTLVSSPSVRKEPSTVAR